VSRSRSSRADIASKPNAILFNYVNQSEDTISLPRIDADRLTRASVFQRSRSRSTGASAHLSARVQSISAGITNPLSRRRTKMQLLASVPNHPEVRNEVPSDHYYYYYLCSSNLPVSPIFLRRFNGPCSFQCAVPLGDQSRAKDPWRVDAACNGNSWGRLLSAKVSTPLPIRYDPPLWTRRAPTPPRVLRQHLSLRRRTTLALRQSDVYTAVAGSPEILVACSESCCSSAARRSPFDRFRSIRHRYVSRTSRRIGAARLSLQAHFSFLDLASSPRSSPDPIAEIADSRRIRLTQGGRVSGGRRGTNARHVRSIPSADPVRFESERCEMERTRGFDCHVWWIKW